MLDDPGTALLTLVLQYLVFSALTVGLFWIGVSIARGLLSKPVSYSLVPLGFSKPKGGYFAAVALGFMVGLAAVLASLALVPLSFYALRELGYSTDSQVQGPFKEGLAAWIGENPTTAIPAIIAVVIFFGPAVEELVFRGAIFGGLYSLGLFLSRKFGYRKETGERVSFALSVLLSSFPFALAHLEPAALPMIFILAVGLCVLYRRSESLLPNLAAHATFNSFAVLLIILSGLGVLPTPV